MNDHHASRTTPLLLPRRRTNTCTTAAGDPVTAVAAAETNDIMDYVNDDDDDAWRDEQDGMIHINNNNNSNNNNNNNNNGPTIVNHHDDGDDEDGDHRFRSSSSNSRIIPLLFPWWLYHDNNNNNNNNYHHDIPPNDSLIAIAIGITTLVVIGSTIGMVSYIITTTSSSHPTKDDVFSSCIGYTYMILWSTSFYPQCIWNRQRQSTTGLSVDFLWYNCLGFICYTTYNVALFTNPTIQQQYRQRQHASGNIPVRSNDVAFAIHALLLCTILLCQVGYYDGCSALRPSRPSFYILAVLVLSIAMYPIVVFLVLPMVTTTLRYRFQVLDYLYFLSYVKVAITCMKYIPQVYYNYRRRSTVGWNIWQILLDLSGGLCSTIQLIYDAPLVKDIVGSNLPKFVLGNISIGFDIIFMVQHYYLYPTTTTTATTTTTTTAAAIIEEEPVSLLCTHREEHPPPTTYQRLSTSEEADKSDLMVRDE